MTSPRVRRIGFAALCAVLGLVIVVLWVGSDKAVETPTCTLAIDEGLSGIDRMIPMAAASSGPRDVWVVANRYSGAEAGGAARRWDGESWTDSGLVEPGVNMQDIEVLSPTDVWVVGARKASLAVADHWDGTTWSPTLPAAGVFAGDDGFLGVGASSETDVWAVGMHRVRGEPRPLTARWDGTAWRVVPSPRVGPYAGVLKDVAVLGPNDVWAVGWYVDAEHRFRTLVEHWDGTSWSVVPSPNAGTDDSILAGVTGLGPNQVWAVGWSTDGEPSRGLVLRWDGTRWSAVPVPGLGTAHAQLRAIAEAPGGVVAVGQIADGDGVFRPLVIRRDRASWSQVPADVAGARDVLLSGVVALPDEILVVGTGVFDVRYESLAMRGC